MPTESNSVTSSDQRAALTLAERDHLSTQATPDLYLRKTAELLDLEHNEEKEQSLELLKSTSHHELASSGLALLKLYLNGDTSLGTALYGRIRACFSRYNSDDVLPTHRFSSGDIVGVFDNSQPIHEVKPLCEGVINRVKVNEIEVVFSSKGASGAMANKNGSNEGQQQQSSAAANSNESNLNTDNAFDILSQHTGPYHLALISSEVTLNRYKIALKDLESEIVKSSLGSNPIIDLCFSGSGLEGPMPQTDDKTQQNQTHFRLPQFHDPLRFNHEFLSPLSHRVLNEPQKLAVKRSLLSKDLHIILGPPGTGKTSTSVALIIECILRGLKLLVCAPSNVAVDNLLERVVAALGTQEVQSVIGQAYLQGGTNHNSSSGSQSNNNNSKNINLGKCIRLGHPARIDAELHKHTLDSMVARSEEQQLCSDIEREIRDHQNTLKRGSQLMRNYRKDPQGTRGKKGFLEKSEKWRLQGEVRNLRTELKKRSGRAVRAVLKNCQVLFSTCAGASEIKKRYLKPMLSKNDDYFLLHNNDPKTEKLQFDLVIVDEAAQSLEIACWIPMLLGKRVVLAGDHNQLSATVKSDEAMRRGLDRTLFGRMHERFGYKELDCSTQELPLMLSSLLSIQYRMNEVIMGWSSEEFYEGKLTAADEVKSRTLTDTVDGVTTTVAKSDSVSEKDQQDNKPLPSLPFVFIDTSGNESCLETESDSKINTEKKKLLSSSRSNPGEAQLVLFYLYYLRRCGIIGKPAKTNSNTKNNNNSNAQSSSSSTAITNNNVNKPASVCIITPYNQQVDLLRLKIAEYKDDLCDAEVNHTIPVNTVDSFQGREADIIILSLVRSNMNNEVGFLSDFRRLNVAITRARKHVVVIGCSQTICSDEILASLYGYALDKAKVVYASSGFDSSINSSIQDVNDSESFNKIIETNGNVVDDESLVNPFDMDTNSATGTSTKIKTKGKGQPGTSSAGSGSGKGNNHGTSSNNQQQNVNQNQNQAPQMTHLTDEEVAQRRTKYTAQIDSFIQEKDIDVNQVKIYIDKNSSKFNITYMQALEKEIPKDHFDFPKSLNSRERLIVHEICDSKQLVHASQGDSKKRFVRVFRPQKDIEIINKIVEDIRNSFEKKEEEAQKNTFKGLENEEVEVDVSDDEDDDDDNKILDSNFKDSESKGPNQSSSSSSSTAPAKPSEVHDNSLLTDLARERQRRQKLHEQRQKEVREEKLNQEAEARHLKLEEKKSNNKKKKKAATQQDGTQSGTTQNQKAEDMDDDDFDALLNEFETGKKLKDGNIKLEIGPSGKCYKCKIDTKHMSKLIPNRCEFCQQEFCLKHLQAEEHGCDDAARRKARGDRRVILNGVLGWNTDVQKNHGKKTTVEDSKQHQRNEGKLKEILKEKEKERKQGGKKK